MSTEFFTNEGPVGINNVVSDAGAYFDLAAVGGLCAVIGRDSAQAVVYLSPFSFWRLSRLKTFLMTENIMHIRWQCADAKLIINYNTCLCLTFSRFRNNSPLGLWFLLSNICKVLKLATLCDSSDHLFANERRQLFQCHVH